ncbi:response regulator [Desulfosporosinus metallidurans]|uniref:Stage 0 sporulation protein A homolog n=1 Tax=Desulfosporosinus metallidurans TaxID=1888891 RepID=A0A1Q8QF06_9FIRM|nr:response regulator transcription factor [Desulfosporosinus metallidurans]OLN25885.1 DNA-binding response regulator, LuxR family [Desulfosporosinus metallidurans]
MSLSSEESEGVKVLVVDDHTLFTEGTVSLLSFEPRILVVGIAKNGTECINLVSNTRTDVVLLDIKLPDVCGTDLIDKIKAVQPEVKIIMLTGHSPKGYVTKSISKGANGFLLKDCSVHEMIQGILRVYNGDVYFSQSLQLEDNNDTIHSSVKLGITPRELLTTRENEIMELVSKGLHNKEVASALGIKVRTANFHVSNILFKLEVSTRLEAVLQWQMGINKEILY